MSEARYSEVSLNQEPLIKELAPRLASSAMLSLALSVSQKVQGPKAPDQVPKVPFGNTGSITLLL